MRRSARVVLVTGVALIVLGARAAHLAFRDPSLTPITDEPFLYLAPTIILATIALLFGLPTEPKGWQPTILWSFAAALAGVGAVAFARLFDPDICPRFVLLLSGVALVPWYIACCRMAHHAGTRVQQSERVLAVVDQREADLLAADAARPYPLPERPFTMIDVLDDVVVSGLDVVQSVERASVTLLLLGEQARRTPHLVEAASIVHRRGVHVRSIETFYEEWLGKLPVSELEQIELMTDIDTLHTAHYAPVKRLLDVGFGVLGVVVLALLLPLVLVGNLVANRGAFLYRQKRIGLDEREFTILKLRTMRAQAGEEMPAWTALDDPRVTPFGRFLRRTHLDELPQAINMIQGSLSAVGPRPEQSHYVHDLEEKLPHYALRHLVKPGLTGWAQVKFHYAASEDDALQKLQYDLYYLRHQSLTFDLRILGRTVRQFVFAMGR